MPKIEWIGTRRRAAFKDEIGLFPVDDTGMRSLLRLETGKELLISTRGARNIRQHRLAWALAEKLTDCIEIEDREAAMFLLKVKAKHGRWVMDPSTGETFFSPGSIAFESLAQADFDILFDRFVNIICTEIVPGLDSEALRQEVIDLAGGELGRRAAAGGRNV